MRNKERIKRILKVLEEIWQNNPDQRFGQLLINLRIIEDDLKTWQMEDDSIEKHLIKIKENENKV
jgi:hypothetical protein